MAMRLPQLERRTPEGNTKSKGKNQSPRKSCSSPAAACTSPSILSTSPMRGVDQFRLSPARAPPTSGSMAAVLGTSPYPREQCYLQAMSPAACAILGTSPSPFMPGPIATSPVAATSRQGSAFFPEASAAPQTPTKKKAQEVDDQLREDQDEDEGDCDSVCSEYLIKNTFIDTPLQRSPSLEKFFGVRKVHSSPPSVMMDLSELYNPFMISTPPGRSVQEFEVATKLKAASRFLEEELGSASDLGGSTRAQTVDEAPQPFTGSSQLSETSRPPAADDTQPVIGSAEVPSRGSALHAWGACKPCAFIANGVCRSDVNCQFCHLCEPGEKKRRRKEWLDSKREVRRVADCVTVPGRQQAMAFAGMQQQQMLPQLQQMGHIGAR